MTEQTKHEPPSLGLTLAEVLASIIIQTDKQVPGRSRVVAEIIASPLKFTWSGGSAPRWERITDQVGIRDATKSEIDELMDALMKGQCQVSVQAGGLLEPKTVAVLHQATGRILCY